MKRTLFILAVVGLASFGAQAASAHPVASRVDRREALQHGRIRHGVRCGELTRAEAWRLRAGQRRVHRTEWRARRDGFVSGRERMRLERMQDRQSRAIWRLKHNARTRGWA